MPNEGQLSTDDVRAAALDGRVAEHPRGHLRQKGFKLEQVRRLLAFTQRVARDRRLQHPEGWLAWTEDEFGRAYRIDFELADSTQLVILVVTAMELEPV